MHACCQTLFYEYIQLLEPSWVHDIPHGVDYVANGPTRAIMAGRLWRK